MRGAVVVALAAGDVGLKIVQCADTLRLEGGDLLEDLGFSPSQAYLVAGTKHGDGRAMVTGNRNPNSEAELAACAYGIPF